MTFTNANWSTPQTVTITGVADALVDGNVAYSIVTAAATSSDAAYNGLNATDVSVTNNDKPIASITVTPTSGLITTEVGGTVTFTVMLNSQPTANVTIGLSSSDTTEGTVSPSSLIFTNANWSTPQTVTITGVDDAQIDGNIAYTIVSAAATSSDLNYNGVDAADVAVSNTDNDAIGIVPIIYYTMDSAASPLVDVGAAPAQNATLFGSPTTAAGHTGNAIVFDGSTQYATITHSERTAQPVYAVGMGLHEWDRHPTADHQRQQQ